MILANAERITENRFKISIQSQFFMILNWMFVNKTEQSNPDRKLILISRAK